MSNLHIDCPFVCFCLRGEEDDGLVDWSDSDDAVSPPGSGKEERESGAKVDSEVDVASKADLEAEEVEEEEDDVEEDDEVVASSGKKTPGEKTCKYTKSEICR